MMRIFMMTLLMICLPYAASAADQAASAFFRAAEDLPLMPGMTEAAGDAVVFDQPGGRVVQVIAYAATGGGAAVADFYDRTLPQLGWRKDAQGGGYVRERERLTIEYGAVTGGPLPVRFTIKPQ